jgi:hypothetical protein
MSPQLGTLESFFSAAMSSSPERFPFFSGAEIRQGCRDWNFERRTSPFLDVYNVFNL